MKSKKQEKLNKLQEKYIAQLPSKIEAMGKAWVTAQNDKDSVTYSELRQLAHNMAGSAGTFGFPSVSSEARNLEHILIKHTDQQNLDAETQQRITDSLHQIASLIECGPDESNRINTSDNKEAASETEFNKLIYIIEDDELLAHEIAVQLHYFDYDVKAFSDVTTAMQAIKQCVPSAMIIDVELPEGSLAGPQFALLLNEFTLTNVPSIFISAKDDWHSRLAAVHANGSAYLTKPVDFNDLLERLDLVTQRHTPEPFRILIVDDMEVLAEHYAVVLRDAGMDARTVSDIDNLLNVLSDFKPELILMDIFMPQCSGLKLASIIRQKDEFLSVPIVFLSTESDPLQHISAMELGGDDFLQKPIPDDRLAIAVRTRAQRFRNLRSHMHRDGLTGLLNHVTIKTHLLTEMTRAQRQHEPLCFAMLDIDDFKKVNDTYGHPAGDRVIKSVARMLVKRLRKSDLIGRYGGEEFAIILPETDGAMAKKLLDDVRHNFSQIVQQSDGVQFNCTLSVGFTEMTSASYPDSMIATADSALYEAKHSGKNTVCIK